VEHDLLITDVNDINVKTGEDLTNRSVAIDSIVICAIYEKEVQSSNSTLTVEGTNRYLIPGLFF